MFDKEKVLGPYLKYLPSRTKPCTNWIHCMASSSLEYVIYLQGRKWQRKQLHRQTIILKKMGKAPIKQKIWQQITHTLQIGKVQWIWILSFQHHLITPTIQHLQTSINTGHITGRHRIKPSIFPHMQFLLQNILLISLTINSFFKYWQLLQSIMYNILASLLLLNFEGKKLPLNSNCTVLQHPNWKW